MVSSKINTKVNYIEKKTLDDEDFGHTSTLYLVELYDIPTVIVLGKQKYTYSNKDIVYYPIYIITIDILNLICKKISKLELDLTAK